MSEERILLLDDSTADAALMKAVLKSAGYNNVDIVANEVEYGAAVSTNHYSVVVSDHAVPGTSIPEVMQRAREFLPRVAMICVSGAVTEDEGNDILTEGVEDYISKDQLWRLPYAVSKALNYEKLLAESRKQLKASQQEMRDLTHIMSHDLKSPLFSMYQIAQMVLSQSEMDTEEAKVVLTAISDDARRLTDMTGALHKFYTMALNEMMPETVNLSALAEDILNKLKAATPYRNVQVTIEPDLKNIGDASLLKLLLECLLNNAWKFTGKKAIAQIEFGRVADSDNTYFVKDNGAGFDMTLAHKLFRPFMRLHSSSDFEGTGMGLASVDRIVKRHDGRAWVDATKGEGTTVYFTLAKQPFS